MATNNVSVAVRIRPKLQKEVIDMCNICTRVTPGEPQIWLGHDKAFTFDHVFDCGAKQGEIYENCVENLVDGCFDGYNATVLAYGQTGSGKTYSMGTGFDVSCPDDQLGIIPRAVRHLFAGINRRKEEARQNDLPLPEFSVTAQFIEIYNEELIDLLCEKSKKGGGGANGIRIQEDLKRGIILTGVENKAVSSAEETLACLKNGSLFRTTGATLMNSESSRSHAIFTLFIKQSRVERVEVPENSGAENGGAEQELITLTAKFNFVDLAGSERLARTGAVGERAREGISINSGLLHLGNVISALGDRSKKASHIPYRDSKLTRVLQDSLGGNSVTTMIACISPCDRDFVETLNTLRYANRAKNIKNKVVANQDSQTQLITELRKQVMLLEQENKELRQGKLLLTGDGELELNDVHLENEMLQRDLNNANIRIKALSTRLSEVSEENVTLQEQIAMNQIRSSAANGDGNEDSCAEHLIKGYLKEINELRSKVMESETTINYYQRQLDLQRNDVLLEENGGDIISKCRQEIELSKFKLAQQQQLNSPTRTTPATGGALTADNENAAADDDMEEDEDGDESGENEYIEEEFEKNIAGQNAELATLMEMIASKEKLIEEAEARQRRIIQLTEHYEQKITSFKTKIKQTEDERDSLMSKLKTTKDDLNLKKVKEDYEKRLNRLQQDVRKFEALKREHQKVVREEHNSKEMLKKMRQEIVEAKHQRVRMISQMKEQMSKHNREIQKNRLVINKLTREDQKKDFKIRDLEQRSNRQKMMLQRREDEIKALRRQVKPAMSDKAAGRIARRLSRGASGHTPQKARNKWANFEQKFNQLINQRIAFEQEEKKLERYLQDRQTNLTLLSTLKENEDDSNNEYIESVQTNIDYLTKCIEDCQTAIMQLEDDNFSTDQHFSLLDTEEAMYIMNKLVNTAVNYAITASQKEEELKEKDARLNSLWNDNAYSNHLLNYMVAKTNFDEENELFPFNIPANPFSNEGLNGSGTANNPVPATPVNNETKFRRLTRTPNELLYDMSRPQQQQRPLQPLDLNATYVANAINNLSDLKEEEDGVGAASLDALSRATAAAMNGTFVKDSTNSSTASSSSKENSLLNNTFIIDHQQQQLGTKPEQLGNSRANSTFVLDQKQQLSPENSPSRTILRTKQDQQQPPSPVAVDRFISDRMTQSLHIDNNAAAAGAANGGESGTGGFGGSRSGAATTVIRKASFNGAADLNRVPSAPSLKELNNPQPVCASSPLHQYIRSPLLRRKIQQQQQQQQQSQLPPAYGGYYETAATNNNHNSHLHSATSNNNNSAGGQSKTRLIRSTSNSNGHHYSLAAVAAAAANANHLNNNNIVSSSSNNNNSVGASSQPPSATAPSSHLGSASANGGGGYHGHHQPSPQSSPSLSQRHPFLHKLPTSKSSLIEYSAGKILPYVPVKADKSFPLQCTHTIVGHRRPVLTVTATSEVLFSGSKDGTAKIWDLNKCEEVYSLNDHPDAVNVVRYDEYNKLIYTVSKSIIKIWDPREHPVCCVNTLHSAGFVGAENISSTDSNPINDIRLSADGSTLFSTSEKLVRVWDLRTFACVGKLNTGHKSLVTCLAVDDEESNENRTIITGSKDHYIKVFELERAISGIHIPKYTLKPPHYDGIETLRLADRGRTLFSGARDGCIKKWDLTDQRMLASLSNCHRDWVLALDTFMAGQYLLSACRGGYLRMWRTEDCRPLGEIQAHQAAIHSMATISQAVFTASSDCSISLWQYREPQANAAAAASSAAASSAFDEDN